MQGQPLEGKRLRFASGRESRSSTDSIGAGTDAHDETMEVQVE